MEQRTGKWSDSVPPIISSKTVIFAVGAIKSVTMRSWCLPRPISHPTYEFSMSSKSSVSHSLSPFPLAAGSAHSAHFPKKTSPPLGWKGTQTPDYCPLHGTPALPTFALPCGPIRRLLCTLPRAPRQCFMNTVDATSPPRTADVQPRQHAWYIPRRQSLVSPRLPVD